jgi:hypothetical protein
VGHADLGGADNDRRDELVPVLRRRSRIEDGGARPIGARTDPVFAEVAGWLGT